MKKISTIVFFAAFCLLMLNVTRATNMPVIASNESAGGVACTMEYAPVCGAVQVQCFTTPCNPVPETFSNKCMLNANKNATFLYNGECKTDLKVWEGTLYNSVAKVLDKSYLARKFTPIQAANYTQSIIQKIDDMMQVSKMKQRSYNKHVQLKRFLQIYMSLGQK